jgi:hypothetical protein
VWLSLSPHQRAHELVNQNVQEPTPRHLGNTRGGAYEQNTEISHSRQAYTSGAYTREAA